MSVENGRCSCCGGALLVDSTKERAKCLYCGNEILIKQATQTVAIDGIATFDTLLLSAQRAIEFEQDYDKAAKKYREALDLKPDDYRVLWGLFICELYAMKWAFSRKGFVQIPGDIFSSLNSAINKYANRAYSGAPEDTKAYYKKVIDDAKEYFTPKPEVKKKGCYIATSVYGDYNCPSVWVLRRYRDEVLEKTLFGRAFIRFYYLVSPLVIRVFGRSKSFNAFFKKILDKKIEFLRGKGIEDTPYKD